jgi:MscS family membrane protein
VKHILPLAAFGIDPLVEPAHPRANRVAALLLTWLWGRLVHRLTRDAAAVRQLALRLTVPGLLALLAWQLGRLQLLQLNLSGAFGEGYAVALTLALIAAGAWAAWLAAYFVVEVIISSPTIPDQSYDAHLLRLLARVAAVVGAAAVLVYGANQVGVPALGLVAGLGVGGFALAAQSTVENLFGGMNLFADRPFRVGDVRSATVVGLVGAGGIGQVFFEAFRGFDY